MDLKGKYSPKDIKDIFIAFGFEYSVTSITEIGGTSIKDLNIILYAKNSYSLNLEIFTYKNHILFNLDAGFLDVSIDRLIHRESCCKMLLFLPHRFFGFCHQVQHLFYSQLYIGNIHGPVLL